MAVQRSRAPQASSSPTEAHETTRSQRFTCSSLCISQLALLDVCPFRQDSRLILDEEIHCIPQTSSQHSLVVDRYASLKNTHERYCFFPIHTIFHLMQYIFSKCKLGQNFIPGARILKFLRQIAYLRDFYKKTLYFRVFSPLKCHKRVPIGTF